MVMSGDGLQFHVVQFVAKQLNAETKKPDKERSERRDARQWTRRRKASQTFRDRRLPSHFSVDEELRIVFVIRNRVEMRLCLRHELARRIGS
ncbi:unnamed protein product [Sphagnum jensenii]|uniref:Uncharacterized protein n=1 Tax=Sphagnum jensenii TaxID=128206 RepID=A0ABP1BLZ7_9BRYO